MELLVELLEGGKVGKLLVLLWQVGNWEGGWYQHGGVGRSEEGWALDLVGDLLAGGGASLLLVSLLEDESLGGSGLRTGVVRRSGRGWAAE